MPPREMRESDDFGRQNRGDEPERINPVGRVFEANAPAGGKKWDELLPKIEILLVDSKAELRAKGFSPTDRSRAASELGQQAFSPSNLRDSLVRAEGRGILNAVQSTPEDQRTGASWEGMQERAEKIFGLGVDLGAIAEVYDQRRAEAAARPTQAPEPLATPEPEAEPVPQVKTYPREFDDLLLVRQGFKKVRGDTDEMERAVIHNGRVRKAIQNLEIVGVNVERMRKQRDDLDIAVSTLNLARRGSVVESGEVASSLEFLRGCGVDTSEIENSLPKAAVEAIPASGGEAKTEAPKKEAISISQEERERRERINEVLKDFNERNLAVLGGFNPRRTEEVKELEQEGKETIPDGDDTIGKIIDRLVEADGRHEREKMGRWKKWQVAQRVLFEQWSIDEETGRKDILDINESIPEVSRLRQQGKSKSQQGAELQRYRIGIESAVKGVFGRKLSSYGFDGDEAKRVKGQFEAWAFEKVSKRLLQVQYDFDDVDPRLWTVETRRDDIVARVRTELLLLEQGLKSQGDWTLMVSLNFAGEKQNLLGCIDDVDLLKDMRVEIIARQALHKFIGGYKETKTKPERILDFLKTQSDDDINEMLNVLGESSDGLKLAISEALRFYIEMGEVGVATYYENYALHFKPEDEVWGSFRLTPEQIEEKVIAKGLPNNVEKEKERKSLREQAVRLDEMIERERNNPRGRRELRLEKYILGEQVRKLKIERTRNPGNKVIEDELIRTKERYDLLKSILEKSGKTDKNIFSSTCSDKEELEARTAIATEVKLGLKENETGLEGENLAAVRRLNDINARGAEAIAYRFMYLFGLAGKFNFDQDPGNSRRDATAELYRPNDYWQFFKEANESGIAAPASIAGPRAADEKAQPLRSFTLLRTWPQWMEANVRTKGLAAVETIETDIKVLKKNAEEVKAKRLGGVRASRKEDEDVVVDHMQLELLSRGYQMMRRGLFHEIDWSKEIKKLGLYTYYVAAAIDIKQALEKPGTKPENATLTIEGMLWMRDRTSRALSAMKVGGDDLQDKMVDNTLYIWLRAALLAHDPRIKGVPEDRQWGSKEMGDTISNAIASSLILNPKLMQGLQKDFGYGLNNIVTARKIDSYKLRLFGGK